MTARKREGQVINETCGSAAMAAWRELESIPEPLPERVGARSREVASPPTHTYN